jgi:hypothetical protein
VSRHLAVPDGVLRWAIRANRESRLGRPDPADLDENDIAFLDTLRQIVEQEKNEEGLPQRR